MRFIHTADGRGILWPLNDYVFKLIFGSERNRRILIAFLSAVLGIPKEELLDLAIMNSELLPEAADDKLGILDILVRTRSGKTINIEIQIVKSAAFFERIAFYKSKMIVGQISAGESYDRIKKTICIVITDFNLIENSAPDRYHHLYRLHDPVDDTYFGEVEEVHLLELLRLPKASDGTVLWEWVSFMKAEEEKDLNGLIERNEDIGEAVKELYRVSFDEEVRTRYELREKAQRDEYARLSYSLQEGIKKGMEKGLAKGMKRGLAKGIQQGREEGREEGKQEGKQEGLRQTALALKKIGLPADQIAEATSLTLEEIAGL